MQNSDEYSDESDSEDLSHEDDFSAYNNFLFRTETNMLWKKHHHQSAVQLLSLLTA